MNSATVQDDASGPAHTKLGGQALHTAPWKLVGHLRGPVALEPGDSFRWTVPEDVVAVEVRAAHRLHLEFLHGTTPDTATRLSLRRATGAETPPAKTIALDDTARWGHSLSTHVSEPPIGETAVVLRSEGPLRTEVRDVTLYGLTREALRAHCEIEPGSKADDGSMPEGSAGQEFRFADPVCAQWVSRRTTGQAWRESETAPDIRASAVGGTEEAAWTAAPSGRATVLRQTTTDGALRLLVRSLEGPARVCVWEAEDVFVPRHAHVAWGPSDVLTVVWGAGTGVAEAVGVDGECRVRWRLSAVGLSASPDGAHLLSGVETSEGLRWKVHDTATAEVVGSLPGSCPGVGDLRWTATSLGVVCLEDGREATIAFDGK